MTDQETHKEEGSHGMSGFGMMAMMMACCMGMFLLLAIIPVLGLPLGIAVGVVGGIGLLFAHQRLTGSGHHH